MDWSSEFISGTISFICGIVFGQVLSLVKRFIKYVVHRYRIHKLKKTSFVFDEDLNIYTVENAVPEYEDITIVPSSKKLYVNIPAAYQRILTFKHSFHENMSFDGSSSFRDLSLQTGIYDLEKLIEIHSERVAKDFVTGSNGCKFNEIKYGVLDVDIGRRVGQREDPVATITTFETDFYTYRVFCSILKELIQRGHEISRVSTLADLKKYNCFICSIGVNVITCIDSKKYNEDEIIFTKRSSNTINYQNMFHISVNEGMCYMDYNPSTGRFSIEQCLLRGIEEELGIEQEYHLKNQTEYKYWDLFLSKDTFDFGITCYVKIKGIYFDAIKALIAKDKRFEIDRLEVVLSEKKQVEEYVRKRAFVPQGLYTLNSYFIRKFGRAIQVPVKKVE